MATCIHQTIFLQNSCAKRAHIVVKPKILKFFILAQNKQHVYEILPGEHKRKGSDILVVFWAKHNDWRRHNMLAVFAYITSCCTYSWSSGVIFPLLIHSSLHSGKTIWMYNVLKCFFVLCTPNEEQGIQFRSKNWDWIWIFTKGQFLFVWIK